MSQSLDSRQWLWLHIFTKLCTNEKTMEYFETHASEQQNIIALRNNCNNTFRQCCTEENSTLLCDFIKDFCKDKGIQTLRQICPEWTFIISQFDCFVLEAKLNKTAIEVPETTFQSEKTECPFTNHIDMSAPLLKLHNTQKI